MKIFQFIILSVILIHPEIRAQQKVDDSMTVYELLEPASHKFRIYYYLTVVSEGTEFYYNTLRKGSEHQVHKVVDLRTSQELDWKILNGSDAREQGHSTASEDTDYLQVKLPYPVPANGEIRILIDKTYEDSKSYFEEDGKIIFDRSLGIKKNSVILPKGYEITFCNYPSQVLLESGKIKASFMNTGPASVPYRIEGTILPQGYTIPEHPKSSANFPRTATGPDKSEVRSNWLFPERNSQTREIIYYLNQPETHSFRLFHDYTETRVGMDRYLNVVRKGSKATDPEAFNLDTGEKLKVETLVGDQISEKGIELANIEEDTEVVVIWYDPVQEGESTRLRIWETYTDPNRYKIIDNELIWDRSFGRSMNEVVLPEGWLVTENAVPAVISTTDDGRIRLRYWNDRPGNIDVYIRGRKR